MNHDHSRKQNKHSGSPKKGEPLFLSIGKIRKPHGLYGEVSFEIHTRFPERIQPGAKVFVGEEKAEFILASVRKQQKNLLIQLEGIDDREEAGEYRNQMVFIKARNLPKLPDDEYYHHDLIGLNVITAGGEELGEVTEIIETGATDVIVVKGHEQEHLFPFLQNVVLKVDLKKREITVQLQDWK